MEYQDLFRLMSGLNSVGKLPGAKFGYAVAKNLGKIEREIKALQKTLEMTDEYKAFDELRTEICKAHAELNDNGKPKMEKNEYVINPSRKVKFDKAIAALKKKHQKAVDDREKQIDDYNDMMETDMDKVPDLHVVKLEELPEAITGQQQYLIREMIEGLEEPEDEKPKPKAAKK